MERSCPAADRHLPSCQRKCTRLPHKIAVVGAAFGTLALLLPSASARAEPEPPSTRELQAKVERLHEQIGTLTEQYNGLRVRLQQAERTAQVAAASLTRYESRLRQGRDEAGQLAASSYMSGGLDPSLGIATASDPRSYLDQATTLYHLQNSAGTKVTQIAKITQAAEAARRNANQRAAEIQRLVAQIDQKRGNIQGLVAKAESKLFRKILARARLSDRYTGYIPVVGTGKGAEAVRYALTQRGKPYVWGAEGPNSYDCSGLTKWAYAKVGVYLPHFTGSQWESGVHVSRDQLRAGDLVFFYGDRHHMGMYIGGGLMVHAPRTGDVVKVSSIGDRPWAGAVRVVG